MPCRDDWVENYEAKEKDNVINKLTALLCETCRWIEREKKAGSGSTREYLEHMPENPPCDLLVWWGKHKKADKERRKKEIQASKDKVKRIENELARKKKELEEAVEEFEKISN